MLHQVCARGQAGQVTETFCSVKTQEGYMAGYTVGSFVMLHQIGAYRIHAAQVCASWQAFQVTETNYGQKGYSAIGSLLIMHQLGAHKRQEIG